MAALVQTTIDALQSALQWTSSGAPTENEAFLSRSTGELFFRSILDDFGEELPNDINDEASYVCVPHKNDLDLGRSLVMAFAQEHAARHLNEIASLFGQRGAYANFKKFLERTQQLDHWYEYESVAIKKALKAWASENGFTVVDS